MTDYKLRNLVATDSIWDAAGDLAVGTGANTAGRLALGGALALPRVNAAGNAIEWGTGGQIAFPATAVPSADANTLDDYEEGTWTPVVQDSTLNNMTMHGSFDEGRYTKIGQLVTVSGYIGTTSVGSASGNIQIAGLPFSAGGGFSGYGGASMGTAGGLNITAGYVVAGQFVSGASYVLLKLWDATTGATDMQASEWTDDGVVALGASYTIE